MEFKKLSALSPHRIYSYQGYVTEMSILLAWWPEALLEFFALQLLQEQEDNSDSILGGGTTENSFRMVTLGNAPHGFTSLSRLGVRYW